MYTNQTATARCLIMRSMRGMIPSFGNAWHRPHERKALRPKEMAVLAEGQATEQRRPDFVGLLQIQFKTHRQHK